MAGLSDVYVLRESSGNIVRALGGSKALAAAFVREVGEDLSFEVAWFFKRLMDADGTPLSSIEDRQVDGAVRRFMANYGDRYARLVRTFPDEARRLRSSDATAREVNGALMDVEARVGRAKAGDPRLPDGSYWLKLDRREWRDEGNRMGHCGEDYRGDLWSYRDAAGASHLTLTMGRVEDVPAVFQIKGKQNLPPDPKYEAALLAFFKRHRPVLMDTMVIAVQPAFAKRLSAVAGRPAYTFDEVNSFLGDADGANPL